MLEGQGPSRNRGVRLLTGALTTSFFVSALFLSAFSMPAVSSMLTFKMAAEPGGTALPRTSQMEVIRPGERVICLYDSSEGVTADRNPLSAVVAPAIEGLGFQVVWHDVAN
ncbi:MAG: hypothetical protein GXP54_09105, partial [Deltaproteobacteria bacterium]|nr:hypothetical protein [Deltaproteobacteria bacterium]